MLLDEIIDLAVKSLVAIRVSLYLDRFLQSGIPVVALSVESTLCPCQSYRLRALHLSASELLQDQRQGPYFVENGLQAPSSLPRPSAVRFCRVHTCKASSRSAISRLYFDNIAESSLAFVRSRSSAFSFANLSSLFSFSNSSLLLYLLA